MLSVLYLNCPLLQADEQNPVRVSPQSRTVKPEGHTVTQRFGLVILNQLASQLATQRRSLSLAYDPDEHDLTQVNPEVSPQRLGNEGQIGTQLDVEGSAKEGFGD